MEHKERMVGWEELHLIHVATHQPLYRFLLLVRSSFQRKMGSVWVIGRSSVSSMILLETLAGAGTE